MLISRAVRSSRPASCSRRSARPNSHLTSVYSRPCRAQRSTKRWPKLPPLTTMTRSFSLSRFMTQLSIAPVPDAVRNTARLSAGAWSSSRNILSFSSMSLENSGVRK